MRREIYLTTQLYDTSLARCTSIYVYDFRAREAVLTKLARGDAHHALKVTSDDIVYDSEWISMWLIPLVE